MDKSTLLLLDDHQSTAQNSMFLLELAGYLAHYARNLQETENTLNICACAAKAVAVLIVNQPHFLYGNNDIFQRLVEQHDGLSTLIIRREELSPTANLLLLTRPEHFKSCYPNGIITAIRNLLTTEDALHRATIDRMASMLSSLQKHPEKQRGFA